MIQAGRSEPADIGPQTQVASSQIASAQIRRTMKTADIWRRSNRSQRWRVQAANARRRSDRTHGWRMQTANARCGAHATGATEASQRCAAHADTAPTQTTNMPATEATHVAAA